ncbi:MAG TPA: helix-turn-helix transcriptional regulator [Chthoniobacteraceae bacterium]|jgi:methylphosphotriester-DNA--protein-cysteine methyltransferase|nr:helix-turn-helix transcriptional regulator [Chthoniobacteraceae bacterium]
MLASAPARNAGFGIAYPEMGTHKNWDSLLRRSIVPSTCRRSLANVGYSHFRQIFKARTGVSPKRFQQELRLRRAQDFLANTDKSLEEIADLLGFSSSFHLSRQFKQLTGAAPRHWRDSLAVAISKD